MFEIDALIACVFERSPIWDKRDKRHANRDIVDKCWAEISTILKCNENPLRKKWKYLRDQFVVERGKIAPSRSGDAASNSQQCKWQYYNALLFLEDVVKPRLSTGNLSYMPTFEPAEMAVSGSSQEDDYRWDDETSTPHNDNMSVDREETELSGNNKRAASSAARYSSDTDKGRGKRQKVDDYNKSILDIEKQKLQFLVEKSAARNRNKTDEDEDLMFFKSLLPHVKKNPDSNKLKFRSHIQDVVEKFAYTLNSLSHSQQTSHSSYSFISSPQESHSYSLIASPQASHSYPLTSQQASNYSKQISHSYSFITYPQPSHSYSFVASPQASHSRNSPQTSHSYSFIASPQASHSRNSPQTSHIYSSIHSPQISHNYSIVHSAQSSRTYSTIHSAQTSTRTYSTIRSPQTSHSFSIQSPHIPFTTSFES